MVRAQAMAKRYPNIGFSIQYLIFMLQAALSFIGSTKRNPTFSSNGSAMRLVFLLVGWIIDPPHHPFGRSVREAFRRPWWGTLP
ncbi:MAG: hypothetical protein ACR2RF_12520 [Geminicoccaceae bacterium]